MRIGLDFDNTLACYDQIFVEVAKQEGLLKETWQGDKREVRDFLRSNENGEDAWQGLQGRVYGRWMHRAQLKPGSGWFLYHCQARQVPIVIVSHKTEYSLKDPDKVPLRRMALDWMTAQGFFDPKAFNFRRDNVFFENTRAEKARRIEQLGCTHFVDDLLEVFSQVGFPRGIKKILYGVGVAGEEVPDDVAICPDWSSVALELLGSETEEDLAFIAHKISGDKSVTRCQPAGGGGNSRIYRVSHKDRPPMALKRYPALAYDRRDRVVVEYMACRFLREHGVDNTPLAMRKDESVQVGLFEWIEGKPVENPSMEDLQQAVKFVRDIDNLRCMRNAQTLPMASEVCLSGEEICQQVGKRRERLDAVTASNPQLKAYLTEEFGPLWERARIWAEEKWPEGSSFGDNLPSEYWTLSPSDFGFHNALREPSGGVKFLDFEYFGWDDPVKLTSDFCWHPGMALDDHLQMVWVESIREVFSRDPNFPARLNAAHPLYGLRWALIVLNGFLRTGDAQRWSGQRLQAQLEKSIRFCSRVDSWISNERRNT